MWRGLVAARFCGRITHESIITKGGTVARITWRMRWFPLGQIVDMRGIAGSSADIHLNTKGSDIWLCWRHILMTRERTLNQR